jgi:hypothetical protein
VTPVNDPPTANDDTIHVAADGGPTAIPVLANDTTGPDAGEALAVTAVTQPAGGTAAVAAGGTGVTFTPAAGFAGTTAFTYTVADGHGGTATATVAVTVDPLPPPPPPPPPPAHRQILVGGSPDGTATAYAQDAAGVYRPAGTVAPFGPVPTDLRTATGDVNGDGTPDLVLVTGPGVLMQVAVIDGRDDRTALVPPFAPFDGFTAGGFASAGDIDRDGRAEYVVTPDRAGGPRVSIFSVLGGANTLRANYFSLDPDFRGGVRTALGDFNRDGRPDLVVAAGFGGGPRVGVIDGTRAIGTDGFDPADRLVHDFFAFDPGLRDGAYPAAGDVDGDGAADLVFGPGDGGPARLLVISGPALLASGAVPAIANPIARFSPSTLGPDGSGVRPAVTDVDGDGRADVVVGAGRNHPGLARVYLGAGIGGPAEPGGSQLLDPFGSAALADGVYVG